MILRKKISTIVIHVFIWSIFIFLPVIVLPKSYELLMGNTYYLINYLATSVISIVFFYFNYYWAIPELYFSKRKWEYIFSIVSFVVISILVFAGILLIGDNQTQEMPLRTSLRFAGLFIKYLIIFIVSWVIRLYQKTKQQEFEKNVAELAFLKAQINPHFLFNTLNGLYALAIKKSDKTADSIAQLSEIMRYVTTDAKADKVPIEKEIEYIHNFIELHRIRLTEYTTVKFNVDGSLTGIMIEPLLLISFIENAFKYGVSTEHKSIIEIDIRVENGQKLYLTTKNEKVSYNVISNEIGIKNTIERLNLSYKNSYKLKINDSENFYMVNLMIKL